MNDDDSFLADAFRRQLAGMVTTETIRAIEAGDSGADLWRELNDSGFADAMLSEDAGGAGIDLAQAFPLVFAAGEYCVPAPFAETMVARGMLGAEGASVPPGAAILLAGSSSIYPCARLASHALIEREGNPVLIAISTEGDDVFGTAAASALSEGAVVARLGSDPDAVTLASAGVASGLMAGAMARVLEMSLNYASERKQFGRSLGKFQAIQQQLAILAEQVLSAQVAARSAFVGMKFDPIRVAAAKCRANEAATIVCNISHAIHGAIGVTREFDLQLYTRRIKQWQLAFGSESYWGGRLGLARLASGASLTSDFLRLQLGTQGA